MKVGFGDYFPAGPGGARDYLRMVFLECVRVNYPAVLRGLRENILPRYVAAADDTAGEQVRPVLTTWAEEIGLSDAWAIDVAIKTLAYWHRHPEAGDFWVYPSAGEGYLSPFGDDVGLLWDPTAEPEGGFARRARRSIAEYRARVKAMAKQAGFRGTFQRRRPQQLEWLVWWQVEKLGRKEIAKRALVSQGTVRKTLKLLAKEMGLVTLRRGKTDLTMGDT